jgi:hypothetical protein
MGIFTAPSARSGRKPVWVTRAGLYASTDTHVVQHTEARARPWTYQACVQHTYRTLRMTMGTCTRTLRRLRAVLFRTPPRTWSCSRTPNWRVSGVGRVGARVAELTNRSRTRLRASLNSGSCNIITRGSLTCSCKACTPGIRTRVAGWPGTRMRTAYYSYSPAPF